MDNKPRIIFFGTTNELSRSTFATLIAGGAAVQAVVVTSGAAGNPVNSPLEELHPAAWATELPLLNRYYEPSLIHEAWTAGIPVLAMSDGGYPVLRELMNDMRPDVACVACFPRRIPASLIALPPLGFLNVHPSLLPHFRGPAPLFWLFQQNDLRHRGVTIHQMDEEFDTGPLVKQEPLIFGNGLGQAMIERQCGLVGGRLLHEASERLLQGRSAQPQMGIGTYHPWPKAADFILHVGWPAIHAFNFMRATDGFSMVYQVPLPGQELNFSEALDVDLVGKLDGSVKFEGPVVQVQFNPGVLTARTSPL